MDNIELLYLEDIEDYCNVTFDRNNLPGGVVLAIHRAMKQEPARYGVASEKISDLSKTYSNNLEMLSADWRSGLSKYRRPFLVGDKRKRPYNDGRED